MDNEVSGIQSDMLALRRCFAPWRATVCVREVTGFSESIDISWILASALERTLSMTFDLSCADKLARGSRSEKFSEARSEPGPSGGIVCSGEGDPESASVLWGGDRDGVSWWLSPVVLVSAGIGFCWFLEVSLVELRISFGSETTLVGGLPPRGKNNNQVSVPKQHAW